jgi:outer membrane protein
MKPVIFSLIAATFLAGKLFADQTNALPVMNLADAEKIALQNHPRLAAANYLAFAAQESAKASRAGYFPTADLVANAVGANNEGTRIMAGGLNNPSVYDRAAGGLQVSQLITDFGHTANLAASSRFEAQAENERANATREQVLLRVNVTYFNTLAAQAVLRVAQQTFDTRQLLLDQVSVLSSNQLKSELDVSFARVALEEGKLLVEKAKNNANAAMTTFSAALGYRESRRFNLSEPAAGNTINTNDDSQLVETALAQRPELSSLRDEHDAAIRFARAERDARLPKIEAVGVAGIAPIRDEALPDNYAAGGIQFTLPLFAGGGYLARQHASELKAQANAEILRAMEDDIIRDVHLASLNVSDAFEQLNTTEQLVHQAGEAYELAESRYKIGSSSIVELSQAQLSLTSAQIAEATARYDVLIQQANLNYQTGMLR